MYRVCYRCDMQGRGLSYGKKVACSFCKGRFVKKIYDYDWQCKKPKREIQKGKR